jgi:large subunit ribosomal protein L30e
MAAKKVKKKESIDVVKMLKDGAKTSKLVIGTNSVLRGIKRGYIMYAIYANNCSPNIVNNLVYYSKISKIDIKQFNGNSASLGEICGKPFTVQVVGIKK